METLYDIADAFSKARRQRLKGNVLEALITEEKAEAYLRVDLGEEVADELLTVWESSLNEHPFEIEEWVKASGHAQ